MLAAKITLYLINTRIFRHFLRYLSDQIFCRSFSLIDMRLKIRFAQVTIDHEYVSTYMCGKNKM